MIIYSGLIADHPDDITTLLNESISVCPNTIINYLNGIIMNSNVIIIHCQVIRTKPIGAINYMMQS